MAGDVREQDRAARGVRLLVGAAVARRGRRSRRRWRWSSSGSSTALRYLAIARSSAASHRLAVAWKGEGARLITCGSSNPPLHTSAREEEPELAPPLHMSMDGRLIAAQRERRQEDQDGGSLLHPAPGPSSSSVAPLILPLWWISWLLEAGLAEIDLVRPAPGWILSTTGASLACSCSPSPRPSTTPSLLPTRKFRCTWESWAPADCCRYQYERLKIPFTM